MSLSGIKIDNENVFTNNIPSNIISSQSSLIVSTIDDEVFSLNKTDSEKFNEIKNLPEVESYLQNEISINSPIINNSNEHAMLRHQRTAEWVHRSVRNHLPRSVYMAEEDNSKTDRIQSMTENDSLDILQMEYNVKKFLLKQNEWSVYRELNLDENIIKQPHRTETNC